MSCLSRKGNRERRGKGNKHKKLTYTLSVSKDYPIPSLSTLLGLVYRILDYWSNKKEIRFLDLQEISAINFGFSSPHFI